MYDDDIKKEQEEQRRKKFRDRREGKLNEKERLNRVLLPGLLISRIAIIRKILEKDESVEEMKSSIKQKFN